MPIIKFTLNKEGNLEITKSPQNNDTFNIYCPYCNALYTGKMLEDLFKTEKSYTPNCVNERIKGKIDIICENCNKLVYRKEIEKILDTTWDN
jgi:hypothetical protein